MLPLREELAGALRSCPSPRTSGLDVRRRPSSASQRPFPVTLSGPSCPIARILAEVAQRHGHGLPVGCCAPQLATYVTQSTSHPPLLRCAGYRRAESPASAGMKVNQHNSTNSAHNCWKPDVLSHPRLGQASQPLSCTLAHLSQPVRIEQTCAQSYALLLRFYRSSRRFQCSRS